MNANAIITKVIDGEKHEGVDVVDSEAGLVEPRATARINFQTFTSSAFQIKSLKLQMFTPPTPTVNL